MYPWSAAFVANGKEITVKLLAILAISATSAIAQTVRQPSNSALGTEDRLVDVGGHRLQFHVMPGVSPTILFEAGAGEDSSSWRYVIDAIHDVTGARLVTYDRAGFGKSDTAPGHTSSRMKLPRSNGR